MSRQVVLLRGVNVGGHRKLPMAEFRALLAELGARNVRTYIQSGNAVFDGQLTQSDILAALKNRFGFKTQTLVLGRSEYLARLGANPFEEFKKPGQQDGRTLHVFFFEGTPKPLSETFLNKAAEGERAALVEGAAYLHAPNGIARSKLAERLERELGVPTTARNWNTAVALRDILERH